MADGSDELRLDVYPYRNYETLGLEIAQYITLLL